MIQFKIKQQLPSLNTYINKLKSPKGKYIGAKFKEETDDVCAAYMLKERNALKSYCSQPVIILFCWNEKAHRRDLDNVYSAKKYILDAMQKLQIIENDDYSHIRGVYDSISYGQTNLVSVRVYRLSEHNEFWNDFLNLERMRLENERIEWEKKCKH